MAGLLAVMAGKGQTTVWRHIAGSAIAEGYASPATGPVSAVWYADRGTRLLAQTPGGRIFETSDFEHWRLNTSAMPVPAFSPFPRIYSARRDNVYASDDSGKTWLNLTGFNSDSVIGDGFTSVAPSPVNPREVVASNAHGVWRSLDGGLSWAGLNDDFPNLPARKLLNRRTLVLADSTVVSVESGAWKPAGQADPETGLKARFGASVTAAAQSGAVVYVGSPDGMLLVSHDSGAHWNQLSEALGAPVRRIWVDAERPDSALAAIGARLLRTVNGGLFWDDVTGSLPRAPIHGIAADRSAGVVYVATDRGVFSGSIPLNDAGPAGAEWKPVSRDLPATAAWDVRLNTDNTLTVALDGYGVFETPAPHRSRAVHIVNGADMSDRPAAPGSVISVIGASVTQGRIGAVSYPVIASSPQSSELQVPFEAAAGSYQIALDGAGERWTIPLTVKDSSPAIFIDEEGAPLVVDASSGLTMGRDVAIRAGSSVQIMTTGLGRVTPDWPTGVPAPLDSPPAVRGVVTAFLDGAPLKVTKATLAPGYIGQYLVELQMPQLVNRGASELRILVNNEESNRVRLYVTAQAGDAPE